MVTTFCMPQMELLQEGLVFCREESVKWHCKLLLINFKKLLSTCDSGNREGRNDGDSLCEHSVEDMLHAVAGVCSVSLPDMEIPAIYSTLTSLTCSTVVIVTSKKNVISCRGVVGCKPPPAPSTRPKVAKRCEREEEEEEEDVNPFSSVISDGEDSGKEEEEEGESADIFLEDRQVFLESAAQRRSLTNQLDLASVGAEHCVLGCAAVTRLSSGVGHGELKPIQLSLLAVRKSCRKMGIGRHLMQCCKDPETVGHYNVLLTFADPKAEDFFIRYGFSEDPILSARYQPIVEHWENSSLMVYMPPFSDSGLAVGSLKSLTHFQEYYKQWRGDAIAGYSAQLGVMERLRHELLLLHSKVQSQDELIEALSKELKQMKQAKTCVEQEFQQYQKHSQRLMCQAAAKDAQEWISKN